MSQNLLTPSTSDLRRPSRSGWFRWIHAPQRLLWRRAIFQVHLWLGLALTLYAIVIGVSGSALVFRGEIEHVLKPRLVHLAPGRQKVPLSAVIDHVQAQRPGWTTFGIQGMEDPTEATSLLMQPSGGPPSANYRAVSVDPYTGEVLDDSMRFAGVLGWLSNLHFYLLAGRTGLLVSGFMALGLLLLCATGIVLWWPGIRRAAGALLLRRRASWRRFNWDLHSFVGFWCCAALSVVTLTGVYFAFPGPTATIILRATGASALQAKEDDFPTPPARPQVHGKVLSVDEAIAQAARMLPKEAPPAYLSLPGQGGSAYSVTGYYAGSAPYSQLVSISFDAHTGQLLNRSDTREQILGRRIVQSFFAIHFGSFGGPGWIGSLVKSVWVLLGLTPAILAITGLVMYWNRKLSRVFASLRNAA